MPENLENSAVSGQRTGRFQFSFQSQRRAMPKNVQAAVLLCSFHMKMGTIKDRNGMDLTEAEEIKKRWHEYTEVYTKKIKS